jgi:antitoxin component YwqK of YwqJK toxin-antitoxin module
MKSNLLLLLSVLFFLSCSKKDDSKPPTSGMPLIKSITIDSTVLRSYWYDSQGRITCLSTNQLDSTVYFYSNNSLEKRMYNDGILMQTEHGILENGNLISMNGIKPDSSSYWSIYYTYDENGFLIREIHMDNDTAESWRVEYQIADGNVISMNRSTYFPVVFTFEYYPGTTNSLGFLEQGPYMGKYSKNLIKKTMITYSSGTSGEENYAYEYYENGWVKKITVLFASQTNVLYIAYW